MHHVAIMKKSWNMIPKILSGEKVIESRWYQAKRVPWNAIKEGDTVFFKNSGELVSAKAKVKKVLQIESPKVQSILDTYGKKICVDEVQGNPKYCILIFLKDAQPVTPFAINKKGFGAPAAWVTINDIEQIKV